MKVIKADFNIKNVAFYGELFTPKSVKPLASKFSDMVYF